jgi:hypothetical protein
MNAARARLTPEQQLTAADRALEYADARIAQLIEENRKLIAEVTKYRRQAYLAGFIGAKAYEAPQSY